MARKHEEMDEARRKQLLAESRALPDEARELLAEEILDELDQAHVSDETRAEWARRAADDDPTHWHTWEAVEADVFSPEEIAIGDRMMAERR